MLFLTFLHLFSEAFQLTDMSTLNLNMNSRKLSAEITKLLSEESINQLARITGFTRRTGGKIDGFKFLDTLLFANFNHKDLSLNGMSKYLNKKHDVEISKQSIDERFNENTLLFFRAVLEKAISISIPQDDEIDFTDFKTVRIKDSTSFQLPENMVEMYPGSGGSASKAAIRIQFEYDLKSEQIIDLSLHPFTTQDMTDAGLTLSAITPNELIIRDLGYVKIDYLRQIKKQGAFYLNRLQSGTKVYEMIDGEYVEIDFWKLYKRMKSKNFIRIDRVVYIGKNEKFETRMIIERLPDAEYQERLRKANAKAKKNGTKISTDNKAKMGLNLFVTNTEVPGNQVRFLYTLRWQIELMFKIWKSIGEIDQVKKMKVERFEACLLVKLLWVVINWHIMRRVVIWFFNEHSIEISPYKLFKSFKEELYDFRDAIIKGIKGMMSFINTLVRISPKNHRSEKKKNTANWSYDIIRLFCANPKEK